jgi:hypothetical protein
MASGIDQDPELLSMVVAMSDSVEIIFIDDVDIRRAIGNSLYAIMQRNGLTDDQEMT